MLQDIKVIAVDQIAAEQKDRPVVAKAVTLEVTPFQAQKISLATSVGSLSLILRKAGNSNVVADRRVTESDLSEGEARPAPQAPQAPAKAQPAPVPVYSGATVNIIRNLKSQEYKVDREIVRIRRIGERQLPDKSERSFELSSLFHSADLLLANCPRRSDCGNLATLFTWKLSTVRQNHGNRFTFPANSGTVSASAEGRRLILLGTQKDVPMLGWFIQFLRSRLSFGLAAAIIFAVVSPTLQAQPEPPVRHIVITVNKSQDGIFPGAVQNSVDRINRNSRRNAANRSFPVHPGKKDRHDQYFHL